jgi:CarD family transcriptional regulator
VQHARNSRPLLAKAVVGDQEDEMSTKKTMQRDVFKPGEFIVYPAHGVGQVTAVEEQEIAGFKLELFVVNFAKEKMTLRVPVAKVASVGMRKLSEASSITRALEVLTGRARIKRTMWSRRAQEYEAKINSGDIIAVAEVVRDLYRSEAQPEQSYSERQLFETALARLVDEVAAVDGSTETEAMKRVETSLSKGPRARRMPPSRKPTTTRPAKKPPERFFLQNLQGSPLMGASLFFFACPECCDSLSKALLKESVSHRDPAGIASRSNAK